MSLWFYSEQAFSSGAERVWRKSWRREPHCRARGELRSLDSPALSAWPILGGVLSLTGDPPILSQSCLRVYLADKNSPNSFVVPPAIPLPLEETGALRVPREGVESRLEAEPSGSLA